MSKGNETSGREAAEKYKVIQIKYQAKIGVLISRITLRWLSFAAAVTLFTFLNVISNPPSPLSYIYVIFVPGNL